MRILLDRQDCLRALFMESQSTTVRKQRPGLVDVAGPIAHDRLSMPGGKEATHAHAVDFIHALAALKQEIVMK